MKKLLILIISLLFFSNVFSQKVVSPSTIKKFSFGLDLYTDLWQNAPDGIDIRTINQGVSAFGMYNYQFGESHYSLAFGAGIGSHNLYANAFVNDTTGNSTVFIPIDSLSYKRSKLSLTYLDIPLEIRMKTAKKFRLALGFKLGFLINKHTKYKGKDIHSDDDNIILKSTNVKYLETLRYGPTFRIGYKWFNLVAYYQMTHLFKPDQGPELYPISVGITLMPF